jgi:hypothetical protein
VKDGVARRGSRVSIQPIAGADPQLSH